MRRPTKVNSLKFLIDSGFSPNTIIDIGVQHKTAELISQFPGKKHILIEPVEEFKHAIRENYKSVDHEHLLVAAGDFDGKTTLHTRNIMGDESNITHATINQNSPLTWDKSREIDVRKLDTLIRDGNYELPFLLKIDVDGMEMAVLNGAVESLKQIDCVIIEASLATISAKVQFLRSSGFILWDIVDLCYYYDNLSQVDLIFISNTLHATDKLNPWSNFKFKPGTWVPFT